MISTQLLLELHDWKYKKNCVNVFVTVCMWLDWQESSRHKHGSSQRFPSVSVTHSHPHTSKALHEQLSGRICACSSDDFSEAFDRHLNWAVACAISSTEANKDC